MMRFFLACFMLLWSTFPSSPDPMVPGSGGPMSPASGGSGGGGGGGGSLNFAPDAVLSLGPGGLN